MSSNERSDTQENSGIRLTRREYKLAMSETRKSRRACRRAERLCCVTCRCETSRRERMKLERLSLQEDSEQQQQQEQEQEQAGGDGERAGVVVHPCNNNNKRQVLITVNTPVGFKLSLDFLPCFKILEEAEHEQPRDRFKDGWIADASNGLLLCTTGKFDQMVYYVSNPLTKQWVALPPAPRVHPIVHIGFIFDPCTNYNDHDDDHTRRECKAYHEPLHCNACKFKVVRFYDEYQCHQFKSQFEVESYSSDVGQWIVATVSSPTAFYWGSCSLPISLNAVFYKGCLHWLSCTGLKIVVYDPYNNKFRGILHGPKRSQVCQQHTIQGLGFSRGSLWLCQVSPNSGYLRFWELKGYGFDTGDDLKLDKGYWSAHRLCNFQEFTGGPKWAKRTTCNNVLAIHPHDPDIVYLQLRSNTNGKCCIVSCNLRTKTLGRARLGYDNFRFRGDVFTLTFPATR